MQTWTDDAWRDRFVGWVDEELAARGIERTAPAEQPHVQDWATAFRVTTTDGVLWAKASAASWAFEPALLPLLAEAAPDVVPEAVAVDAARGWSLVRDAGPSLREAVEGPALHHWQALLPRYAEVQRRLAADTERLLAAGVPDLRPERLPDLLARAAAQRQDDGLLLPSLAAECRELAGAGIPLTLQHDDLHDGNVTLAANGPRIIDWGDACLSHPFHTLVVTLRVLSYRHGLPPGGAEVLLLRDSYLEAWSDLLPRPDLERVATLALRTGTVQRGLAWWCWDPAAAQLDYALRLYRLGGRWGTWDDGTV